MVQGIELANKIAAEIGPSYSAMFPGVEATLVGKVWSGRGGQVRVYIKSARDGKYRDLGYVAVDGAKADADAITANGSYRSSVEAILAQVVAQ